ncbi:T9SS type A sorting domain-containing protein [Aequorivita sp. SDUM287046]|uniref:T9SS type A sorting domain-containing protein n=1 Tax=Aequorivita aurantiaca TaxID=3053356 RepID=A0ABT8DE24_9FLAO|nr:T9SS type A sorting domain-containing protein [Aequorivita aurantiaca]MDN3723521.1 T9SS type A sorting domain-containing protein [Aequorivita aurantiaca]
MKKIILVFLSLFSLLGITYAQQVQKNIGTATVQFSKPGEATAFTDLMPSPKIFINTSVAKTNTEINGSQRNPTMVQFYLDRTVFQAAYPHTLIGEDFSGGPGAGIISVCGPIVSSSGDGCFSAGELEDGFTITASTDTVIYIGSGAVGNTSTLMGASLFADITIINFPSGTYAVGMDIFVDAVANHNFRVYNTDGMLLIDYLYTQLPNTEVFFGVTSEVAIGRIEIEAEADAGELFGNLEFGMEPILSIAENNLAGFKFYPNPTNSVLSVMAEGNIDSISIFNLLGQKLLENKIGANNAKIDLAALATGNYIMEVIIGGQAGSYKIVKN